MGTEHRPGISGPLVAAKPAVTALPAAAVLAAAGPVLSAAAGLALPRTATFQAPYRHPAGRTLRTSHTAGDRAVLMLGCGGQVLALALAAAVIIFALSLI